MPKYTWDDIETFQITPGKSTAVGKTIVGEKIILQLNSFLNSEKREDGSSGGRLHSHDEELLQIIVKGELHVCEDGKWDVVRPGDVFHYPANVMHEAWASEDVVMYFIKNRINGHSIYDMGWEPGAEDAWKKICDAYNESEQFENHDPWFHQKNAD